MRAWPTPFVPCTKDALVFMPLRCYCRGVTFPTVTALILSIAAGVHVRVDWWRFACLGRGLGRYVNGQASGTPCVATSFEFRADCFCRWLVCGAKRGAPD